MNTRPVKTSEVPTAPRKTLYPGPFAALVAGRSRQRLGDFFGLSNFGVNMTELAPGAISALLHHHTKQDEFIYIVAGTPTLMLDDNEYLLQPGECCGFKAGSGIGHQLVNKSAAPVVYLEIGDRVPDDYPVYPNDDLKFSYGDDGNWLFTRKDGSFY